MLRRRKRLLKATVLTLDLRTALCSFSGTVRSNGRIQDTETQMAPLPFQIKSCLAVTAVAQCAAAVTVGALHL